MCGSVALLDGFTIKDDEGEMRNSIKTVFLSLNQSLIAWLWPLMDGYPGQ